MSVTWEYECNRCDYKVRAEGLRLALGIAIEHHASEHPPLTLRDLMQLLTAVLDFRRPRA